jgi:hypothetical protein
MALLENIRLVRKNWSLRNAAAYFVAAIVGRKKVL